MAVVERIAVQNRVGGVCAVDVQSLQKRKEKKREKLINGQVATGCKQREKRMPKSGNKWSSSAET